MLDPIRLAEIRLQETRDTVAAQYLLRREIAFIKQLFIGEIQLRRAVEMCCGSGSVALALKGVISGLIGMDINPLSLALFRQQSEDARLIIGDALHIPIARGGIDCVLAIHCLDHINRPRFLEECNRVLAGGGLLIVEASNRKSYKWKLKKLRREIGSIFSSPQNDKWINIMSCDELMQMIIQNGFEILKMSGYNWIPFKRSSNHHLVNMIAGIEQLFKVDKYYQFSPNVLVAARKVY